MRNEVRDPSFLHLHSSIFVPPSFISSPPSSLLPPPSSVFRPSSDDSVAIAAGVFGLTDLA